MGMRRGQERVRLNVGGKEFLTSRETLARAGRDSMLGAMIHDDWNTGRTEQQQQQEDCGYFIDRNPAYFSVLLDFLRTGELHIPPNMSEKALYREALYYGLIDTVHVSRWDSLDGNRMDNLASISGHATGDATAIRADGEGGCCVAHGAMVHVYDWTMDQMPPLSIDYLAVNDVAFIDPRRLVISTCATADKPGRGGMAAFNTKTGELVHRFQLSNRNFTGAAVSSGDGHVYAGCKGRSDDYGLGVWDQTTGQQVDFVPDANRDRGFGDAGKLQWVEREKLLLVSTLYPRGDRGHISMVDFRTRGVVWSWDEWEDDKTVLDSVATERGNIICVVNQYDNVGFMDTRMRWQGQGDVKWSHRNRPRKMSDVEEKCYSKLAACATQLFCSSNGAVNVLCAPEWVLTTQLRSKRGGDGISDMAVGGDRLFVLRNDENVFDVWQTPNSSHGGGWEQT